jgi:hypothetical protein
LVSLYNPIANLVSRTIEGFLPLHVAQLADTRLNKKGPGARIHQNNTYVLSQLLIFPQLFSIPLIFLQVLLSFIFVPYQGVCYATQNHAT